MAEIYSVELLVCATAYIVADSEAEAQQIANGLKDEALEFSDRHQSLGDDICMHGGSYASLADNDERVALSPAMTVHGGWHQNIVVGGFAKVEFVEDLDEES